MLGFLSKAFLCYRYYVLYGMFTIVDIYAVCVLDFILQLLIYSLTVNVET